jgi:hypothetical protein
MKLIYEKMRLHVELSMDAALPYLRIKKSLTRDMQFFGCYDD